jgi:hypothetical protein
MEIHAKRSAIRLLAAGAAVALAGCASIGDMQAMEMEQVLAKAGFNMKFADTAEQRTHLETLTQRKLVAHPEADSVLYVYADAARCKCIYVGDEPAYERYRTLAIRKKISESRVHAVAVNEDGPMRWGLWGGRNSWF